MISAELKAFPLIIIIKMVRVIKMYQNEKKFRPLNLVWLKVILNLRNIEIRQGKKGLEQER